MRIEILPKLSASEKASSFNAKHPMFRSEVPIVPKAVAERISKARKIYVLGMGGSVLPLRAFTDLFQLGEQVQFIDTVDFGSWKTLLKESDSLFCLASKSGETLEIKALLAML